MKAYYIDLGEDQGKLIATHEDSQNIDPALYGPKVKVMTISNLNDLQRIGPEPAVGGFDDRPISISSSNDSDEAVLSRLKANALKTIFSEINNIANTLTGNYPEHERLSWGTKEAAANDYLAGKDLTDTQKAMLEAEKNTGGYNTLDDLCNTITKNASNFMKVSGALAGIRSAYTTELNDAASSEEVTKVLDDFTERLKSLSPSA